ncbi:hypothetical protein [Staphylococcus saprophyticus]|uniref:hypothetical protein n=1 Tax=Staphylococcus saprophyticus TaxID=29385 RepID=UPI000E69D393|nr:hypothetical protein [Staphylococcus saprophyticus]RIO25472.1 hypothetical protein BUZ82_05620 [Staphylococcus saprophyticus]
MNRNDRLRKEFEQFLVEYFKPNVRIIAEHIGMNYTMAQDWKLSRRDLNDASLDKIEKFLKEYRK